MKIIEMKHKVILLLLLTLMHFSCQNKNEIYDDELIFIFDSKAKNIFLSSKKKFYKIDAIVHAQLFVKVNSNEFALTDISELAYFYKISYKSEYSDFKSFLYDIINQKISLKRNLISELEYKPFFINQKNVLKFTNLGMNRVLKKYFVKEGEKWMLNYRLKLSDDDNLALQYYMFLNKKYISSDCISGFSYCYDFEVYRKELKLKQ